MRPKRLFAGPRFYDFALSAVSEEFGHIFRAPKKHQAGIRTPEKGQWKQIWAIQD